MKVSDCPPRCQRHSSFIQAKNLELFLINQIPSTNSLLYCSKQTAGGLASARNFWGTVSVLKVLLKGNPHLSGSKKNFKSSGIMCAISTDYYQSFLKSVILSKAREKHSEGENILWNIKVVYTISLHSG